jgi:penicillin-binding protein 1A
MVDMLGKVTKYGTLAGPSEEGRLLTYTDAGGKKYTIPCAGKTGTTQNWSDAWTVGFSPYYTTAIWFGFDTHGNSLGTTQSGATIAGAYWADYMKDIHQDLPAKTFQRPQSGLVEATVCSVTGLLPTPSCNEGTTTLLFLDGTQPNKLCDYHSTSAERDRSLLDKIEGQVRSSGEGPRVDSKLRLDLPGLDDGSAAQRPADSPQAPPAESAAGGATESSQSDILN